MAYETDLLEFNDIFSGSEVLRNKVNDLKDSAYQELKNVDEFGGLIQAIENGYMKSQLVKSQTKRQRNIESGEQKVVGVNCFEDGESSPLISKIDGGFMKVDENSERSQVKNVVQWKAKRNQKNIDKLLSILKEKAKTGENIMEISIKCAHEGVTTGEWSDTMRDVFGEYRAPTGIVSSNIKKKTATDEISILSKEIESITKKMKRRPKMLVGKPGLDGHSNGAEQIAVRARDIGIEVVYDGIRSTPEQLVVASIEEGVNIVGLSILSKSHIHLVKVILDLLKKINTLTFLLL